MRPVIKYKQDFSEVRRVRMKKLQSIIGTVAMILLIVALLITSFQIAIYGDSEYKFYEKEYEKYEWAEYFGRNAHDGVFIVKGIYCRNAEWILFENKSIFVAK